MEVQINIDMFYSKFEEFRRDKLHCDVNLEVGEQVFPCHKVVLSAGSQYFSNMFNGNFEESENKNIVLNDIDAAIFEQILCFIYTGRITLSDKNSFALLLASEYFDLRFMEDLCTGYIRNDIPISNAIKIFIFAYNTGKASLLEVLKLYIAENFETFYTRSEFLEVPIDAMKLILNCATLQLGKRHDVILHSIIRWVSYSPDERKNFGPELLKVIDFEKVSAQYVQLLSECMVEYKPVHENLDEKCSNSDVLYAVDNLSADKVQKKATFLNVIVLSEYVSKPNMTWYGIGRNSKWSHSKHISIILALNGKVAVIEDKIHLFTYYYAVGGSGPYLVHYQDRPVPSLNDWKKLQSPPPLTAKFDVCNVQSNIYFYNKELVTYPSNSAIYSYASKLDTWSPVAKPKFNLNGSYLVSYNNVIYLLGGYSLTDSSLLRGYVQSYDPRMPAWSELPDTTFRYNKDDASVCVHYGKIYIAGGSCCPREVEVFDPTAGKWETIKSMNRSRMSYKLVSYNNYLWAIGSGTDLSVELYDCKTNQWINTNPMDNVVNSTMRYIPGCFSNKVVDAYVFG